MRRQLTEKYWLSGRTSHAQFCKTPVSEILFFWKLSIVIVLITEGLERKNVTVLDFLEAQGFNILLFSCFDLCWNNICTISLLKCIFNKECGFPKGKQTMKNQLICKFKVVCLFCLFVALLLLFVGCFLIKCNSHCSLCMTLIPSLIRNPGTSGVPAKVEYLSLSNFYLIKLRVQRLPLYTFNNHMEGKQGEN